MTADMRASQKPRAGAAVYTQHPSRPGDGGDGNVVAAPKSTKDAGASPSARLPAHFGEWRALSPPQRTLKSQNIRGQNVGATGHIEPLIPTPGVSTFRDRSTTAHSSAEAVQRFCPPTALGQHQGLRNPPPAASHGG